MQPPVTVIVPVHNGAAYIAECLDSLLAQTYTDWECIIVENCSADETYSIAQSYAERDSRIQVRKFDELLPVVQNHNRAFALVPEYSRYCKPLMADDWIVPECLARMVAPMEAHPSIGVVGCYVFDGYRVWNAYPYPAAFVPGREMLKVALKAMGTIPILGNPTGVLMRSDLVRKRHPLLAEWHLGADYETALDMLTESDFSFIHQVLCVNRIHRQSVSEQEVVKIDPYEAIHAFLLNRYGPAYLSEKEMEGPRRRVMRDYYRMLAHRWFRIEGRREYRAFHRENFRRMNMSMEYREFLPALFREILGRFANPVQVLRSIRKGLSSR